MMNLLINRTLTVAVTIGVWSLVALVIPENGFAKQFPFGVRGGMVEQEEAIEAGAVLKTDPELEDVLEKAERMRNDGQYRVACTLWQAVLNRSGDALFSSD
ncbi:MAG: hypothetical protein GY880_06485, partial [Planctomycetaceae bacterium]|nr:hypothetical protein [Planctomycetaceae bacterium]